MNTALVIMANDRPRGVHIGSEAGAQAACDRLRREHYQSTCAQTMSMQAYRSIVYWRVYHPGLQATTDHD